MKEKYKKSRKLGDRGDYWRRYYEENRERERQRKREWYLANRDSVIARNQKNQREADPVGPVYRVGIKRRYLLAGGRVFFNSKLGFSAAELRAIIREMAASAA